MVGNLGMLPAVIVAVIVGPLSGELPAPNLVLGSIIKIPDFAIIWNTLSPFAIGSEHRKDHFHDSDSHRCLYHRIRRFRFQRAADPQC